MALSSSFTGAADSGPWRLQRRLRARRRAGQLPDLPRILSPGAGPAYHVLGFDIEFFAPIFVMARITGWTAHIVKQNENNSLIRPLSAYNGEEQRSVPPKQI